MRRRHGPTRPSPRHRMPPTRPRRSRSSPSSLPWSRSCSRSSAGGAPGRSPPREPGPGPRVRRGRDDEPRDALRGHLGGLDRVVALAGHRVSPVASLGRVGHDRCRGNVGRHRDVRAEDHRRHRDADGGGGCPSALVAGHAFVRRPEARRQGIRRRHDRADGPPERDAHAADDDGHHPGHRAHPPEHGRLADLDERRHVAGDRSAERLTRAARTDRGLRRGRPPAVRSPGDDDGDVRADVGMRRAVRFLVAVSIATLAFAGMTGVAWAHADLLSSDPAGGSTVQTAPTQLTLNYSEEPDPQLSQVVLLNSSGATVATGAPALQGQKTLVVPITGDMPDGVYTVSWSAVSVDDGHTTTDSFSFGVGVQAPTGPATAAPAPTASGPTVLGVGGKALLYAGLMLVVAVAVIGEGVFGGAPKGRPRLAAWAGIAAVV